LSESPTTEPLAEPLAKAAVIEEIGRTGLYSYGGYIQEEFLQALKGRQAIKVYTEMRDNDPIVGAVLFVIEMMMRQAEWRVDPVSETNPLDVEAATFLRECMDDMEDSWADTIAEIMSFLPFGWSLHEQVYKKRNGASRNPSQHSKFDDGLISWRKFPVRAQDSLLRWEFDEDNDELIGMTQVVFGNQYTIPIEKALLFRSKVFKRNPEGRSVLRNAYRPWYLKKKIEEVEGIGIERDLVGFPTLQPPEGLNLWDKTDPEMVRLLAESKQLVQNIRQDAQMGAVIPFGWELGLVQNQSRKTIDIDKTIQRWDQRIAMTMLADFILVGHGDTGTYALHRNKTSNFGTAIGAWLDMIEGVFNSHAVPQLFALNPRFASLEELPKIGHSAVETPDLHDLGEYINYLVSTGVIKPDLNLENHLRTLAELPEAPIEDQEAAV
jgi:hypothetical protein